MNTTGALQFLLSQIIDIYCYIVFARFILQLFKADFYNPLSQFVVKATSPVLNPIRKVIPGFFGIDFSALLLLYSLQLLKVFVIFKLLNGIDLNIFQLIIGSIFQTLSLCIGFFIFVIFVQIILSWVAPQQHNPMTLVLHQISEPILAPARRLLPPMGGLDLSPMVVILILYTIKILLGV